MHKNLVINILKSGKSITHEGHCDSVGGSKKMLVMLEMQLMLK